MVLLTVDSSHFLAIMFDHAMAFCMADRSQYLYSIQVMHLNFPQCCSVHYLKLYYDGLAN